MSDDAPETALTETLINAFTRLAKADFTVRLPRNFKRDNEDLLAMFVNLIAEELERLTRELELDHKKLEADVARMSELFLGLAGGNFSLRAPRSGRGDPLDVLAFLFNNMAGEIEEAFAEIASQRTVFEAILESMLDGVLLCDELGNIRRSNQPLARALGYPASKLVGMRLSDLLAAEEQDFSSALADSVRKSPIKDRDTQFRRANGDLISVVLNCSPHADGEGTLLGIVLVARDPRPRKI